MSEESNTLEKVVLTRLLRLNAVVHGVVVGLLAGIGIFVATNWLILAGDEDEPVGPHLSLLGQFFIGYDVTFAGSLIGFGYGLAVGFAVGYSVARLYNWIVDLREAKSRSHA